MINVENLSKKFGEKYAVRNLSFKVSKGKIWGFLGPNGAGKTTTMRILTGYLPPSEGKASVANLDPIKDARKLKSIVGYLPENPPLYFDMTVDGYLNFVGKIKGVKSKNLKERVDYSISKTGLDEVRGRLIRNLSKGYKQRVAIAQSLIHSPEVLILDEPTLGLDPAQIIEIRELIKSFKEDHTIILSTHILAEVTQICDGVVIINEGKLVAQGELNELTSSFSDREGIFIKIRKEGAEEKKFFENFDGVKKVEKSDGGFRVEWEKGKNLKDRIIREVVIKEMGLLEVRPLSMDLEEIYLKAISQ
ncbi:MAG: ATP-binding cassette domain-containing protein [Acidobacteriota bacterium]